MRECQVRFSTDSLRFECALCQSMGRSTHVSPYKGISSSGVVCPTAHILAMRPPKQRHGEPIKSWGIAGRKLHVALFLGP